MHLQMAFLCLQEERKLSSAFEIVMGEGKALVDTGVFLFLVTENYGRLRGTDDVWIWGQLHLSLRY